MATREFNEAREHLKSIGMTISRNQEGEYRVNFKNAEEATAYYTDNLEDALRTGQLMSSKGYLERYDDTRKS